MSSCCGVCGGQDADEVKTQEHAEGTAAEAQEPTAESGQAAEK